MAFTPAQSAAFNAGSGVAAPTLSLVIASIVLAVMTLWTAWIVFGHWRAWCDRRLDAHDLLWSILRACIWLMLLTVFIRP